MIGSFLLGLVFLVAGFLMLWRTRIFREFVGDLATVLGSPERTWLDWKLLGVIFMFVGMLLIFGILPRLLSRIVGNISHVGL